MTVESVLLMLSCHVFVLQIVGQATKGLYYLYSPVNAGATIYPVSKLDELCRLALLYGDFLILVAWLF